MIKLVRKQNQPSNLDLVNLLGKKIVYAYISKHLIVISCKKLYDKYSITKV